MQYELLDYLRCPITKTRFRLKVINEFNKSYANNTIKEIKDGLLYADSGFVFPIINGIPRILIESIYDYSDFLSMHILEFQEFKTKIETRFRGLLRYCVRKNKNSKSSFEFEWSFLNVNKADKIWHDEVSSLLAVFINEMDENLEYYKNKTVIDIGCGHGLMTNRIASVSKLAIGVELSKSIEDAYTNNQNENAWYLQGDLQFLPFDECTFDLLYSSGVIHHTNNTELSLSLIEPTLKDGGKICLWLYHPQKGIFHNYVFLGIRKFTKRLPVKISFLFLMVFIFPFTFLVKKVRGKRIVNSREEIIDLLDGFTPEFRFEVLHDLAIVWLQRRKYNKIKITTKNQFGFSITGNKKSVL